MANRPQSSVSGSRGSHFAHRPHLDAGLHFITRSAKSTEAEIGGAGPTAAGFGFVLYTARDVRGRRRKAHSRAAAAAEVGACRKLLAALGAEHPATTCIESMFFHGYELIFRNRSGFLRFLIFFHRIS
jgi:hypothetical protein